MQARSSVHLAQHDVQGSDYRHYVRYQAAPYHAVQRLKVDERGWTHTAAVWLRRAVAHYVIAQFALGGFDGNVGLAHRRLDHLGNLAHDGARRNALHRLLDDPRGLAHFLHAHDI